MTSAHDQGADAQTRDYVRSVWRNELRVEVPPDGDFFRLGGSSMQAIVMLVEVSSHFGHDLDFAAFYEEPTVDCLCRLVREACGADGTSESQSGNN